jgi:hypothetical protein
MSRLTTSLRGPRGTFIVLLAAGMIAGGIAVVSPIQMSAAAVDSPASATEQADDAVNKVLNPAQVSSLTTFLASQLGRSESAIGLSAFHLTSERLPSGAKGPDHFVAVVMNPNDSTELPIAETARIQGIVLPDRVEVQFIAPGVGTVETRRIRIAADGSHTDLGVGAAAVSYDAFGESSPPPDLDPPTSTTPSTGVPSTGVPSTGVPSTGVPSTGVPSTGVPSTGVRSTGVGGSGRSAVLLAQHQSRGHSTLRTGVQRVVPAGGFDQGYCVTSLTAPVLIDGFPTPSNHYIESGVDILCNTNVYVENNLNLILDSVTVEHSYLEGFTYPSFLWVFNHYITDDCIPIWANYQYYSTQSSVLSRVAPPGVLYNTLIAGPTTIGCWASPWN